MLYIEDTSIPVAGVAVPGLVKELETTEAAVIGTVTDGNNVILDHQPDRYEPLKMNMDLLLESSTGKNVEGVVQTIQLLFKPSGQMVVIPLSAVNSQTAAYDLNLACFKGIDLSKKTENGYGEAALESWECLPVTVQTKATGSGKNAPFGNKAGTSRTQGISIGYQEYLSTQGGQAPRIKDKTSESSVQDT